MGVPSTRITGLRTMDLRAPTSRTLAGSDAVHTDPDYSLAYVTLSTDGEHEGTGFTFTIGRGNDQCCAAIESLAHHVVGRDLADLAGDMAGWWRSLTNDSQLRWLGPDKGTIHLAAAAVVNAVWDLWAKVEGLPLWGLVASLTPEELLGCIDLRHLTDAVDRDRALDVLQAAVAGRSDRLAALRRDGYPAYITSAGWLGYPESLVRDLCRQHLAEGWTAFKTKVGVDVASDVRRCEVLREELGDGVLLMADANQVWDVPQAIEWMHHLRPFGLRWIEEPTHPDDVLGHAAIRAAVRPVGVATGEHAANRVIFKQLLQAGAVDYVQIDACRLGGVNEVLAVLLLAAVFERPVCPHAGGIGLCEYVQHLSVIDHLCFSGSLVDRTTEYASHLHEHFVDPAVVRGGRYLVPERPGYSADLVLGAAEELSWPDGGAWRS